MRGRGLRFALLAALATVGVLALAGCASQRQSGQPAGAAPAAPAKTPGPTAVRTFHAYDAHGQLTVQVGDVASGRCWTASIAAPGPGSYRCLAGNQILDPCFVSPTDAKDLACLNNPWSDAVVLRVSGALPSASAGAASRPWAIILANGARCVAATGTVPSVGGVNLGYVCPDGAAAALADATAPTVSADYAGRAATALHTVTVTTIWRA